MPEPVLALINDLLFSTRVADAVRAAGGEPVLAGSIAEFRAGLERWPALILLDLSALPPDEWRGEVQRAKASPQSRLIPLYAFGSHLDAELLAAARQAGCDHAWARSRFVQELPALAARHLNPPPVYLEGWDDQPAPAFLQGVALFNAGDYYRQHDVFEALWREDTRPIRELYQGVLQIGVALYQVQQGNYRGAIKMLRRGLLRLRDLPPVCQRLDVDALRHDARRVHDALLALGPERLDEFNPDLKTAVTLHWSDEEPTT